jgi:hypothetical protein
MQTTPNLRPAGSGSHVLQWCYTKNGSVSVYYDCGWVDYVQWTGLSPRQDPTKWDATTYLYDGDHIIAEYDGNNNLVRKLVVSLSNPYVYGPRVDEPVCMIDLADSNAVYYYHFDGLGSVVALTDANGTCVQTYEYSVYGHVAASSLRSAYSAGAAANAGRATAEDGSDPNHPNPFMFTGRQFDIETGPVDLPTLRPADKAELTAKRPQTPS